MNARGAELPKSLASVKVYSAPVEAGSDLIGRRFEKWDVGEWINSKSLTLRLTARQGCPDPLVDCTGMPILRSEYSCIE